VLQPPGGEEVVLYAPDVMMVVLGLVRTLQGLVCRRARCVPLRCLRGQGRWAAGPLGRGCLDPYQCAACPALQRRGCGCGCGADRVCVGLRDQHRRHGVPA
jgi:hypothetical protein